MLCKIYLDDDSGLKMKFFHQLNVCSTCLDANLISNIHFLNQEDYQKANSLPI